jgi:hypothetical protein
MNNLASDKQIRIDYKVVKSVYSDYDYINSFVIKRDDNNEDLNVFNKWLSN